MQIFKRNIGLILVSLLTIWAQEENYCQNGIRKCSDVEHSIQKFYEDNCSKKQDILTKFGNNTDFKIVRTVASLYKAYAQVYLNFERGNKSDLQDILNEINNAVRNAPFRLHISTWGRKTWISFRHTNENAFVSFDLSTTLCGILGFTSCHFKHLGEFGSESEQDQEGFGLLSKNHTLSVIVQEWYMESINLTMRSSTSLYGEILNIMQGIKVQTPKLLRTFINCEKPDIGIMILNNRKQKLILSEEISKVFGSLKITLDNPMQILHQQKSEIDTYSWDNSCGCNISISDGISNKYTFVKLDTLQALLTSINNLFKSDNLKVIMRRIIVTSGHRIEISFTAIGIISTLILPSELTEILGFNTIRFKASGVYTSEEDWDMNKYNRLGLNHNFELAVQTAQTNTIHFTPENVLQGNSIFPAIINAATKAIYKFGNARVHFGLKESHLSVYLFDELTTLKFSPCIHELLQIDPLFLFQSKSTTLQIPHILAGDTIPNQRPQRFIRKSPTEVNNQENEFPITPEQPHSSWNPPLTSISPLSGGYEEDQTKCNHLINEVLPTKRYLARRSTTQLLEILYKCGTQAKVLKKSPDVLDGYMLIIVDIGGFRENDQIVPGLVFSADLAGVQQRRRIRSNGLPEWYSVVGTNDVPNVDLNLDSPRVHHMYKSAEGMSNAIPFSNDYPTAVFLIYFKYKDRYLMKKLSLKRVGNEYSGMQIEDTLKSIIKPRIIDYFLYGSSCGDSHVAILKSFDDQFPDDCYDKIFSSGHAIPFYEQEVPFSYGRCSLGNKPYQIVSFKDQQMTPGSPNKCPIERLELEFNLKDVRLQTSAQKILLNVWSGIRQSKTDPSILEGTPTEVTTKLTGVGENQIVTAEKRWRENSIVTPQKHRKSVCNKQIKIDSFDQGWIRGQIIKRYSDGAAKNLQQVFKDFIKYKDGQYETLLALHLQHQETTTIPEKFSCGYRTFRKVIKLMGFKYGVVNKRAGILQREDIVVWRGKYLRYLRKNEAAEEPKEVVFIDETWIDENTRVARGWYPHKCENLKDMAPYTYGTEKLGKGPRLVVLSAVTEKGIIPSSVLVYKVSKAKTAVDYHDNVNAETFGKWYNDLLTYLDSTGKKYIIVMDNAAYHSTKLIPSKSENKPVLYKWLKDQLVKDPSLNIELPDDIKDVLKWELVEMVERISQSDTIQSELYLIDQLTKARGHAVLRLPPYNCDLNPIELCWKDCKHELRKLNTNKNLDTVREIAINLLKNMDKTIIKRNFEHVKRLGAKYWQEDKVMDNVQVINPIIVTQDDEDADDDSDYEEDDGEDFIEGDEVDLGGEMTLWDCDWAYDIFQNELEIGEHMAPAPIRRRNNRYRVCNIQQVHSVP